VTVLQTAKKSGRAIVSAMVNTSDGRWKVRLLAELFSSAGYDTYLITKLRNISDKGDGRSFRCFVRQLGEIVKWKLCLCGV